MFLNRYSLAVAVLLAGLPGSLALAQGAAAPKFAYINSETILQLAPDRALIAAQFQKEMAPVEARLKAINDSNAVLLSAYQKDLPTLTPEARATREQEIAAIQAKWGPEAAELREKADRRGEELERPIMEKLRRILDEIRQEGGYWMIVDVAAQGGLGIVAIDKNLDITDRVLAAYKAAPAVTVKADTGTAGAAGPVNATTGVGRTIPPSE